MQRRDLELAIVRARLCMRERFFVVRERLIELAALQRHVAERELEPVASTFTCVAEPLQARLGMPDPRSRALGIETMRAQVHELRRRRGRELVVAERDAGPQHVAEVVFGGVPVARVHAHGSAQVERMRGAALVVLALREHERPHRGVDRLGVTRRTTERAGERELATHLGMQRWQRRGRGRVAYVGRRQPPDGPGRTGHRLLPTVDEHAHDRVGGIERLFHAVQRACVRGRAVARGHHRSGPARRRGLDARAHGIRGGVCLRVAAGRERLCDFVRAVASSMRLHALGQRAAAIVGLQLGARRDTDSERHACTERDRDACPRPTARRVVECVGQRVDVGPARARVGL